MPNCTNANPETELRQLFPEVRDAMLFALLAPPTFALLFLRKPFTAVRPTTHLHDAALADEARRAGRHLGLAGCARYRARLSPQRAETGTRTRPGIVQAGAQSTAQIDCAEIGTDT